jgi:signal transduction histidine kinase
MAFALSWNGKAEIMLGIRQKLMLGFGGLLAVITVIGVLTMAQIRDLGRSIDVILTENYRSVVACQDMNEALERMDRGVLFSIAGDPARGEGLVAENTARFLAALDEELGNITLAGEEEKARRIQSLFADYTGAIARMADLSGPLERRQADYFEILLPLFHQIKVLADQILKMNQANMSDANDAARRRADSALGRMGAAIAASALIALVFGFLVQRWVLVPINRLMESVDEIRRGNLDLVLEAGSGDEIGRLSALFNEMAVALRRARHTDRLKMLRTRRATEAVFKALPTAVAVVDPGGRVEVATTHAEQHFGMAPGVNVHHLGLPWLAGLLEKALAGGSRMAHAPNDIVQQFIDNREYFYQPMIVPIHDGAQSTEPAGAVLILHDVTQVQEQRELKRGAVSSVLHQLRTPLTSLRLSIHLLLEEKIGALNDRQTELLVAAREDSARLAVILDDLLDLSRIESGRMELAATRVRPQALARDAIEDHLVEARDRGVTLVNDVADDLPDVMADTGKIRHVFANLLANALRFTTPGGTVRVGASAQTNSVRFWVSDTGTGIAPEHIADLFEPFYRGPGQDDRSGVGLGLAIVKQIVVVHGGQVSVESRPGNGSTFSFTLPTATESPRVQGEVQPG